MVGVSILFLRSLLGLGDNKADRSTLSPFG